MLMCTSPNNHMKSMPLKLPPKYGAPSGAAELYGRCIHAKGRGTIQVPSIGKCDLQSCLGPGAICMEMNWLNL